MAEAPPIERPGDNASSSGTHLFLSAGDVSGDLHASHLIRELSAARPGIRFTGLGGLPVAREGLGLLKPPDHEVVMGFRRVLGRIPHFFRLLARIAEHLRTTRPEAVILVDYPGLNVRIAGIAKGLGLKVIYFICPQLWAWAPWRMKRFARSVDLGLVIFPFEEAYFRERGVQARYMGHPSCRSPRGR